MNDRSTEVPPIQQSSSITNAPSTKIHTNKSIDCKKGDETNSSSLACETAGVASKEQYLNNKSTSKTSKKKLKQYLNSKTTNQPKKLTPTENKTHKCYICRASNYYYDYETPSRLLKHIKNKHPELLTSKCDVGVCGNSCPTCKTVCALSKLTKLTPTENKPHKCPFCETCYDEEKHGLGRSLVYLRQHIKKKHPEKLTFKCDVCRKPFTSKAEVDDHLLRIHKLYQCHVCNKRFVEKYHLDYHSKHAHPVLNNM